ncbi:transcription termination/antitermination NusG family protein [Parvibium lacunae]|uniref:Transcription/translation regulatory transformer protein RfaH n=1 Tax=Parvibium lacunae TaxID=1888893 RepID=A0A368L2V2_9BURK|nr:transcription termination/antitermination NusG family protein [Parvibium lacunae]RCS57438.1 transcription/translation regulatory transformer protein RfaH [Parvibium lacunae]
MTWYVIYSKPKQERIALENLCRQGYEACCPLLTREKTQRGKLVTVQEPLFPRYLFVQLQASFSSKAWSPIRSTIGVVDLLWFGDRPAQIDEALLQRLLSYTAQQTQPLAMPGQTLPIMAGPLKGLSGEYQGIVTAPSGEQRALLLIELLGKQQRVPLPLAQLKFG